MARRLLPLLLLVSVMALCLPSQDSHAATEQPVVRVGCEQDFYPYSFVDEQGHPSGFGVELINAVAGTMGLTLEWSTGTWNTRWSALVSGELDVLPVVAKLPNRVGLVDFSLPHTETFDAFFVRKGDSPIPDLAAVRGKSIVVMRSDSAHHELLNNNFESNLVLVDTIPEGLALVASGQHDAFLGPKLICALAISKHGINGLVAGEPISSYKRVFSFAVKKGDDELREKLNQGLLIIKTNGEYERLYQKWLTVDDPAQRYGKKLIIAFTIALGISLIAMVISQIRKRALALSEAMFRAVSELSPMSIYASSGPDQKATYTNGSFHKTFGFSLEDVPTVGRWWEKAFPDEKYRQQVMDQWAYNIEQGKISNTDVDGVAPI